MTEKCSVEGIVEGILFRNENNGYTVLALQSHDEVVIAVGVLGGVDIGERLVLTGRYVQHAKFGVQLKIEDCERKLPNTKESIVKYLSHGAIKGIGSALAQRIVQTFGTQTLEIMANDPSRLLEVKGMTPKKCSEVARETKKIFALRDVIAYFELYEMKTRYAMKAFQRWGEHCQEILEENPYLLCEEGIDMPFAQVEAYAKDLHVDRHSPYRVGAGILYILRVNTNIGHTCVPLDRLAPKTKKFLGITEIAFYDSYQILKNENKIVEYVKKEREFVYLPEYFEAEQYITDRILLMHGHHEEKVRAIDTRIEEEEKRSGIVYAKLQKKAISLALTKGMLLLTGGPGTGKTTTLNAIISLFKQEEKRVMIAAPTGRAAKRISDLTGYEAKTIHRLLETQFDSNGNAKFARCEKNPLSCDVLIIDEMSMVDVLLFSHLLRALRLRCQLILVGDSDQLPSVGAGNLLGALLNANSMPIVELTEIFRQAKQSCIVTNAHKIVKGDMPDLLTKDNDFFFFHRTDFTQASDLLLDLVCRRLPNAYGYSPTKDIQVISPARKGSFGVVELNRALQEKLNPPSSGKAMANTMLYQFRTGDKVMQNKNNYDITWKRGQEEGLGIFNGDIGQIQSIDKKRGEAIIDFEGRLATYPLAQLDQLELAYAITVHKSQGSEFDVVVLPLIGSFQKLSYRNLLYTAVTRAKKLMIIIGTPEKVEQMVKNNRRTNRYSCLYHMLGTEMEQT